VTRKKPLVLMLCFTLLQACSIAAAQRQLSAEVSKRGVGVIVAELVVSKPNGDIAGTRVLWWGTDLTSPNEVVADLRVTVAREPVVIPFSAFSDLAEPRVIRVLDTTAGFSLEIEGSDAAGAYRATLEFVGNRVARRRVVSREFPDERWDEFLYSFVPDDVR
jgi:hypothetical protein